MSALFLANLWTQIICQALRNLFCFYDPSFANKPQSMHRSPRGLPVGALWWTPEENSLLFLNKSHFMTRLQHLISVWAALRDRFGMHNRKRCWLIHRKISEVTRTLFFLNLQYVEANTAVQELFEVERNRNGPRWSLISIGESPWLCF